MNKSKITAYTALATVMSASAAYADLSLSGLMAGTIDSGDATTGISSGVSTSSGMAAVYIAFVALLKQGDHIVASRNIFGNA